MPISLSCACGKRIQVRDELAGKKVRCPACSEVLAVPVAAEDEPPAPRSAAVKSKAPARPAAVLPRGKRSREEEDEEGEERPRRPRRKAAKSNQTTWIIVGVAAGILLLGGVATAILLMKKKDTTDTSRSADSGGTKDKAQPAATGGASDPNGGSRSGTYFGAALRTQSQNNLKQLYLAVLQYHDTFNQFPAPIGKGPDGLPLLSWRVALLPYMEQGNLFNAIRKTERWDSEYNRQFWKNMPKSLMLPGKTEDGTQTYYQAFQSAGNTLLWTPNKTLPALTKGSSNMILIAEAKKPVNWMAPDDIPFVFSPKGFSPTRIGGYYGDFANVALADGSVRQIGYAMSPKTLQGAITLSGDGVGADWNSQ